MMAPEQNQEAADRCSLSGAAVALQLGDWSREIARTLGPDGKRCSSEELERVAALSLASLNLCAISFLGFLAAMSPPPPPPRPAPAATAPAATHQTEKEAPAAE